MVVMMFFRFLILFFTVLIKVLTLMLFTNLYFCLLLPIILGFVMINSIVKVNNSKRIGLLISFFVFLCCLLLWNNFSNKMYTYQFVSILYWVPFVNKLEVLGVDGLSFFFVLLTAFLIPICLLASWSSVKKEVKSYIMYFLFLDLLLLLVFLSTDVLLFYVSFEGVLIPMYILIGVWGSRERKIRAGYLFFFYTLLGSIFMLLGIIYIYVRTGSTSFEVINCYEFSLEEQAWLWLSFFLSLASKIPMFPFHVWLPEAHVEAPTAGSVLLAGVLLKLGSYGFLRYSLILFSIACYYFSSVVYVLALLGVVLGSLTAIRQTDLKRIIAYSSVAHMNLVMLGIFSFGIAGTEGSILQSLSHGFVASGLFLLIGVLYDRTHSREVYYYSGLSAIMPVFSLFFLVFTMANIAIPGTSSFVGEFLILVGIFSFSTTAGFIGSSSMVLGGVYSLWLLNRIIYGNIKIEYMLHFNDFNIREFFSLFPLIIGVLIIGFYPEVFLKDISGISVYYNMQMNIFLTDAIMCVKNNFL